MGRQGSCKTLIGMQITHTLLVFGNLPIKSSIAIQAIANKQCYYFNILTVRLLPVVVIMVPFAIITKTGHFPILNHVYQCTCWLVLIIMVLTF